MATQIRYIDAQPATLQAGLGGWPGAGLQAGFVQWGSVYTLEIVLYASSSPWQDNIPLFLSAGFGGSLRPIGILREIGRIDYTYDLDIGIRVGPSLFFRQNATRADKNRQFSLFVDPFVRYSHTVGASSQLFAEVGSQRPRVRLGLLRTF